MIAKHGIEGAARVLRALAGERSTRRESGNLHLRRAPSGSQGLSFPVFPPPRGGRDGGDARDPAAPCPGARTLPEWPRGERYADPMDHGAA